MAIKSLKNGMFAAIAAICSAAALPSFAAKPYDAEVDVKTRKLRLYMANFEGKSKAAAAFKNNWMKSSKLVP